MPDGRAVSFFGDLHPSFAGNVVKAMGGAKQGYPVVSRMLATRPPRPARPRRAEGAARPRVARPRACGRAADPDHRRGRRRGADGGARLPARPVLSPAELRDAGAAGRRHDAGDGRAGADRRLGRSRARPAVDDRARDGRLVRSLRLAEAGRAGDPDGADRHADRDPGGRDRAAGRRRARQRGAVLDRRGVARGAARACSISPATRRSSTATRSPRSSAPPTGRLVLRRGAGFRAGTAAGPGLCRQHRRGDRGLRRGDARARSISRSPRSTASSRSARTA